MTNATTQSASQTRAALALVLAVSEAIRDLGKVPSGVLYAQLMSKMSLEQYTSVIAFLKRSGLVSESANELTWTGPKLA